MQMTEVEFTDAIPVDGYGPGYFRIAGKRIDGAMIVADGEARAWEGLDDADALLSLAGRVDVLFVGMGREIAHLPRDLQNSLEKSGLGVETMSSSAACRTYNVLASEGRRVAIAVLPVQS